MKKKTKRKNGIKRVVCRRRKMIEKDVTRFKRNKKSDNDVELPGMKKKSGIEDL